MKLMFASDPKLTSVVLSFFNTSVVTDMSYMFAINDTFNPDNKLDANDTPKLTEIKGLDKFDTTSAKQMHNTFSNQKCFNVFRH